jgi:hypothetical protein
MTRQENVVRADHAALGFEQSANAPGFPRGLSVIEQVAHRERSIQFWSLRHLPLRGAPKGRIVDANAVKDPGWPCCGLDRLQDKGFALASNGDSVSFEVKLLRQFHELAAVCPYDFSNFHRNPLEFGLNPHQES